MRATRVDDSSSGDGLPSHRHIDTVGRRVVIPDTATGISEQATSQGTLTCTLSSCTTFDNESGSRHASPRCDTLSDLASYCVHREVHPKASAPNVWHCF